MSKIVWGPTDVFTGKPKHLAKEKNTSTKLVACFLLTLNEPSVLRDRLHGHCVSSSAQQGSGRSWGLCWAVWTEGRKSRWMFMVSGGHLVEGVLEKHT